MIFYSQHTFDDAHSTQRTAHENILYGLARFFYSVSFDHPTKLISPFVNLNYILVL
jgi:hypothetical protein